MRYRPEIDGLRAIAVLSVIFFHAGFSWVPGGFVGVDIFFVISGYLITNIILQEHGQGRFSFLHFYERRIRRIFPALFVVMLVSFATAWLVLLPDQMRSFSRSLGAAALMVSNIFFYRESGYFDTESVLKPLLHTWSLGIEEQFYLVYPLLLLFLLRFARNQTWLWLFAVLSASFVYSDWLWRTQPDQNFYLIFSRGWELMAGAWLAVVMHRGFQMPEKTRNLLAWLGLALVMGSLFVINENLPFPSKYTLMPIVGATLVLGFADDRSVVGRGLAHPWLVFVGLTSYSLYLWHQPVLAFARIHLDSNLSGLKLCALLSAIFVLSVLSWKYVERPFRRSGAFSRRTVFVLAFSGTGFLLLLAVYGVSNHGLYQRFDQNQVKLIHQLDYDTHHRYFLKQREFRKSAGYFKKFSDAKKPNLLVIGDSYAEDFLNGIRENNALSNYEIRLFDVSPKCQFYLGNENVASFIPQEYQNFCTKHRAYLNKIPRVVGRADVVVIVTNWRRWSAERISETVRNLGLGPNQKIVVIGTKNFGKIERNRWINYSAQELSDLKSAMSPDISAINAALGKNIGKERFIDQQKLICNAGQCPVFTPAGDLISYDGGHLSKRGAEFIGARILRHPAMEIIVTEPES